MRRRTRARETAVQFLYQADLRRADAEPPVAGPADARGGPAPSRADLESFLDQAKTDGLLPDEDSRTFARRLILGTLEHTEAIDQLLRSVARNWDLKRMAVVDRNVLRMAIYELLHCPDIPPKVTINEAIEIGKKFSTANSGAFINGILDRIRLDHLPTGPGDDPPGDRSSPAAPD
jgi:N utilization substance protein B